MNAMLSSSVLAILLTLASQAGAQATPKPSANAKPGTGKTANVIMTEGGGTCPKGPDGADACTVVVNGERSGGGGGGDLPNYDPGQDARDGPAVPTEAFMSKEATEIA